MRQSLFLKWVIVLSIVIVANMLFNYSLSVFFERPVFEEICPDNSLIHLDKNREQCSLIQGQWVEKSFSETEGSISYCSTFNKCNAGFEDEIKIFEQKVFFVLVIAGAGILIMALLIKIPTLSLGFGLAALVDFIFASIRYWEYSDDLMRVAILFVTLLSLVFIAITRYIHRQDDEQIQSQGNRK